MQVTIDIRIIPMTAFEAAEKSLLNFVFLITGIMKLKSNFPQKITILIIMMIKNSANNQNFIASLEPYLS